jgi:hypothetical protein
MTSYSSISKDAQADYLWRDTRVLEVHPAFEVILEKRNKQNSDCLVIFKTNERQQSTLPGI